MASWLGFWAFIVMLWVQSLVGELRSCKPYHVANKQINKVK